MLGIFLLLTGVLLTSCDTAGEISFEGVFDKIISIGNLEFLTQSSTYPPLVGFMRIMVAILIFVILSEAGRVLPFGPNARITLAIILAVISAIFIPGPILAGIGGAYATLFAFILIGVPILGGLYLFFRVPSDTAFMVVLRIAILLLILWILLAVKNHALSLI